MTAFDDAVQEVLTGPHWNSDNVTLAAEIIRLIPEDDLPGSFMQVLITIIPLLKRNMNIRIATDPYVPPFTGKTGTETGTGTEKRDQRSPKAWLSKSERFLSLSFQGATCRVNFRTASVADILAEAERLQKKGETTLAHAQLMRTIADEITTAGVRTASGIPAAAQEKFADEYRKLYTPGER